MIIGCGCRCSLRRGVPASVSLATLRLCAPSFCALPGAALQLSCIAIGHGAEDCDQASSGWLREQAWTSYQID
eukprot:180738-Rhodomonas_salina.2